MKKLLLALAIVSQSISAMEQPKKVTFADDYHKTLIADDTRNLSRLEKLSARQRWYSEEDEDKERDAQALEKRKRKERKKTKVGNYDHIEKVQRLFENEQEVHDDAASTCCKMAATSCLACIWGSLNGLVASEVYKMWICSHNRND